MTADGPVRRSRRKRYTPNAQGERCQREGCSRPHAEGKPFCASLCYIIDSEISKAERRCRDAGPGSLTTELWVSATELGDALTNYLRLTSRVCGLLPSPTTARALGVPVVDGDG